MEIKESEREQKLMMILILSPLDAQLYKLQQTTREKSVEREGINKAFWCFHCTNQNSLW
jgi:hypothetical protein